MQAMHIDIGVFHECGEVGAQDVQDRIENYAREEGAMAIVAGTKTAAAGTVVLIRGVWQKCKYGIKTFNAAGAGGSRLMQITFRGTGKESHERHAKPQWLSVFCVYGYNNAAGANRAPMLTLGGSMNLATGKCSSRF